MVQLIMNTVSSVHGGRREIDQQAYKPSENYVVTDGRGCWKEFKAWNRRQDEQHHHGDEGPHEDTWTE